MFKVPTTRTDFWLEKIGKNRTRDAATERSITDLGWRAFYIWECTLRGKRSLDDEVVLDKFHAWLASSDVMGELPSRAEFKEPTAQEDLGKK